MGLRNRISAFTALVIASQVSVSSAQYFSVTASSPSNACYTTSSGRCFTDGSGNHANNERCSIRVLRSTTLSVSSFSSEGYFDRLTVNGRAYSGSSSPNGVAVSAGSTMTWYTDGSVTRAGFVICGSTTTSTGYFSVTRSYPSSTTCYTTSSGNCITDGSGNTANNERCTFRVLRSTYLRVLYFHTERYFDRIQIGSTTYSGTSTSQSPNGVYVAAGSSFTWYTDGSVTGGGFSICGGGTATATRAPTRAPAAVGYFQVTYSSPSSTTCYTTSSGTCVTDGSGNTGNNERCTIRVLRSTYLRVTYFHTERGFDRITIGGTSYSGTSSTQSPNGRYVAAGSSFTWYTDGSVTGGGFNICSGGTSSRAPTRAPAVAGYFQVTRSSPSSTTCYTTSSGTCVTDGSGNTGNNERCTIRVLRSTYLRVTYFHTERYFDRIQIGSTTYSGTSSTQSPNGRYVAAGSSFTWYTDGSVTGGGFNICSGGTPSRAPTRAPASGAYFRVTRSSPSSTTCYTTTSGTCVTDGAGTTANNERCTISVLRSTYLRVTYFSTERYFDRIQIGSTSYSGTASPNGRYVAAGSSFTWYTDGSVVGGGFNICSGGAPTRTPTRAPTRAPAAVGYFQVTRSYPSSTTCYTTTSGTCITDGSGNTANNERCTFRVLRSTYLRVLYFNTERGFDRIQIGSTTYSGTSTSQSPNGRYVAAGSSFTWYTDGSVTGGGFNICSGGTPSRSPTRAPVAGAYFQVTASAPSSTTCYTTSSGNCVTDGSGNTGNNERCTIRVLRSTYLRVTYFHTERYFDRITISGTSYSGTSSTQSPNGRYVTAGSSFTWYTDGSVTGGGFNICSGGTPSRAPTRSPTRLPTRAPTRSPVGTAYFQVTTSLPTSTTCYTTSSGTCVTDGSGTHANNERCTIRVLRSTYLRVTYFNTERYFDRITIAGTSYSGTATANGPNGRYVAAGSSFTWYTDGSVTYGGFTICSGGTPSRAPTRSPTRSPTRAPQVGAFFRVTRSFPSSTTCYTTSSGSCVTDGSGNTANNERCTISVLRSTYLRVTYFHTERGFDRIQIGSTTYSGTSLSQSPNGVYVAAGSSFTWYTDGSVTGGGFNICSGGTPSRSPTRSPTRAPSRSPTRVPTAAPTVGLFTVMQSSPSSTTCYTTNSGNCITDGTGTHANNERCTIRANRNTYLVVSQFSTESGFDRLTVNGRSFSGTTGPVGQYMSAATTLTWSSDGSITNQGFVICGSITAPPGLAYFQVTASSPNGACYTTSSGSCVTDGPGNHANNERCTIRVLRTTRLRATEWSTEGYFDRLTVNGVRYSGSSTPNNIPVSAGTSFTWYTDGSVLNPGFTICGGGAVTVTAAPTRSPTRTPTRRPTRQPSVAPTLPPTNTGAFFQVIRSSPASNTCYTTNSGSCITDGAGLHGNNERCTFQVLQSTRLRVLQFSTESFFDRIQIGTTQYSGATGPNNVAVGAGQVFTWSSDGSVLFPGFTICAAPATNAPVTAAPVTNSPVTASPTTLAPVTAAPVTPSPTAPTAAPVTAAPVVAGTPTASTTAPVTAAPVTAAPVTAAPITDAPVTAAPTTAHPTTLTPTSHAPVTGTPVAPPVPGLTPNPTSLAPTTAAPTTTSPTSMAPIPSSAPVAPVSAQPVTAAPTAPSFAPVTVAPTTDAPVTVAPTTLSPLSSSASSGAASGGGGFPWWIIAVIAVCLVVIIALAVYMKSGGGGAGGAAELDSRVAFTNPIYEEKASLENPEYGEAETMGDDGYLDIPDNNEDLYDDSGDVGDL